MDLVNTKVKLGENQEMKANLGLNANTGFEAGADGIDVKVLGLGVSLGRDHLFGRT